MRWLWIRDITDRIIFDGHFHNYILPDPIPKTFIECFESMRIKGFGFFISEITTPEIDGRTWADKVIPVIRCLITSKVEFKIMWSDNLGILQKYIPPLWDRLEGHIVYNKKKKNDIKF